MTSTSDDAKPAPVMAQGSIHIYGRVTVLGHSKDFGRTIDLKAYDPTEDERLAADVLVAVTELRDAQIEAARSRQRSALETAELNKRDLESFGASADDGDPVGLSDYFGQ